MFGELPKVFDRDFAIAYFIPVAAFLAASLQLLSGFGLVPGLETQLQQNLAIGITVIGLVSWLTGVLLMAINREIYRTLEGYGRFNPARLLGFLEKCRFQRLRAEIKALDDKYRPSWTKGRSSPWRSGCGVIVSCTRQRSGFLRMNLSCSQPPSATASGPSRSIPE